MGSEDRQQHWEIWGVAAVVTIAVLVGLVIKGFSGETVVDAIKDIGSVAVPILAAVLAARLVIREMDPEQRFVRTGEDGLRAIQKKHPTILSGPKPNTENYDSDNPGNAGRYLFFQKNHKGHRSQLVPVLPFAMGVVEVRVSKRTLQLLGLPMDDLETISKQVREAVLSSVKSTMADDAFEVLESKNPNIAVAIDFDEGRIGPRGFRKSVLLCVDSALGVLLKKA
ncbi:MAG: hypothetical protein ABIK09_02110 [Pseudomonadota bacterium]